MSDGDKVRVQKEDFDLSRELAEIRKSSLTIGGIVFFLGVARDFSQGKAVDKLEFEFYPGMAERSLEELRQEAIQRFGLIDMRIIHRHGELLPGENIVLIVAASQHREGAFQSSSWCIAELKKRTPIWKKEYTADGDVWVEEAPK